jgi:hypothetical protein
MVVRRIDRKVIVLVLFLVLILFFNSNKYVLPSKLCPHNIDAPPRREVWQNFHYQEYNSCLLLTGILYLKQKDNVLISIIITLWLKSYTLGLLCHLQINVLSENSSGRPQRKRLSVIWLKTLVAQDAYVAQAS